MMDNPGSAYEQSTIIGDTVVICGVEELALQNLLRQQNQDENSVNGGRNSFTAIKDPDEQPMEIENTNPLDLDVATVTRQGQQEEEEEEEEEDAQHEDLAQYVESLTGK